MLGKSKIPFLLIISFITVLLIVLICPSNQQVSSQSSEGVVPVVPLQTPMESINQSSGVVPPLQTPMESIKILNLVSSQNVSTGKELIISGQSSDTIAKDCSVYIIVNDVRPYQSAVASGTGGAKDFSQWKFVLHEQYTHLNEGNNKITAKLLCNTAPTRWYSVVVNGVPNSNVSEPLSPVESNQQSNVSEPLSPVESNQQSNVSEPLSPVESNQQSNVSETLSPVESNQQSNVSETLSPVESNQQSNVSETLSPVESNQQSNVSETLSPVESNQQSNVSETLSPVESNQQSNVSETSPVESNQQSNVSETSPVESNQQSNVSETSNDNQLLVTISPQKNPVARGDTQNTTITVTDSNHSAIANAQIDGKLIYPGKNFEKEFKGSTDFEGKFVYSWIVGKKGDVGPLVIEVEASSQGYPSTSANNSFEIVKSDESSKIENPFQSNFQKP